MLTPSGDYVVIGTPGPYTWRGTLYVSTVSEDFIYKDTVVYNTPMQEDSPVNKYSYLGECACRATITCARPPSS